MQLLLFACVAVGALCSIPLFVFLQTRRPDRRSAPRTLLRLALALSVALVISELCVRLVMTIISGDTTHPTHFDAELGWSRPPGDRVSATRDLASAGDDPNIVLAGDSVAFGHGVAPEHGMVHQTRLLVQHRGWSVLNAAVSGYGIDQTSLYVKRHLPDWESLEILVVVLFAGNDWEDTAANMRYGRSKPLFRFVDGRLQRSVDRLSRFSRRNLLSESRLVFSCEALYPSFSRLVDDLCGHEALGERETQRVVRALLEGLLDETEKRGIDTVLVLVPARIDFSTPSTSFLQLASTLDEIEAEFLDLLPRLQSLGIDARTLYLADDPWHLSAEGNTIVAGVIADALLALPADH
jgi:hypothetical protein